VAQFPTEEEVLAAVEQAGWLLEQQAVRLLEQRGFNPRPSWAFQDPDEPTTSRELDVWSFRNFLTNEQAKVQVSASVLVECKQSETPYCAIGQELPEWRREGNPAEHELPVFCLPRYYDENGMLVFEHTWDVLGFRSLSLQHGLTDFRANQLTRLDRKSDKWTASNTGIFTSLVYPLAKAVRASQTGDDRRSVWDYGANRKQREGYTGFTLRFPVVLISCPLYVIDAGGEQPVFDTAKWVRVQRHLESASLKGLFEFDVVTKDAFEEYIQTVVEGLMSEVASMIGSAPLRYTGEQWEPVGGFRAGQSASRYPAGTWP
jgi:hypothetical protein